jgi:general secretion pathway protein F
MPATSMLGLLREFSMPEVAAERVFHFRAGAPEGGIFSGSMRASSEQDALAQLRRSGYQPLRVSLVPIRQSILDHELTFAAAKRVSIAECEALCVELSILLKAGLELADAVAVVISSRKRKTRPWRFAQSLRQGLRLGRTLSQATKLSEFELPSDFVPVIRAGEDSGGLPRALELLAATYADRAKFSRVFVGALTYPAFLLGAALLVLGVIAFFVAPSLAALFASMDRPVPLPIAVLHGAATWLTANALVASVIGGALVLGAILLFSRPAGRNVVRAFAFRLPVVGSALTWSASRRFATTLQLYVANKVAIASALPNAFVAAGFPDAHRRGLDLAEAVRKGGSLSSAVARAGMPHKLVQLLAVGESSGRLQEVLMAIVEETKIRFERRMALLSSLLAPSLILLVGAFVGTVIFAVFSALLEINQVAF